jgi:phage terminase large subunit-like protein
MSSLIALSRQDKIDYLEAIAEKERRVRLDPLKYARQHSKQQEVTKSMAALRVLFWANRVGKTEWGGQETGRYATANHPYRKIAEGVEIWVACPSYEVQEDTTQKKLFAYLPEQAIDRIDYLRGKIIKKITMKNRTEIVFKSYDQGREKFQGTGKRLIWFDEEPPKDIWEECFVRVEAGQQLDVILTMTPVKGMTWVYSDLYLATNNPDLFISSAGWDDNPYLTTEQKDQMSRGLSKQSLLVRREGKFVKRVGLVCAWWDRSKHVRHYDGLNPSWTWLEVLDGGWSDPAAWLLVGIDNDNNVHVVSGFRQKQLGTKRIKELRNAKIGNLTISGGWIDTDNPRLQAELAKSDRETGLGSIYLQPVEKKPNESKSWDETLAVKLEEYGKIQAGIGEPRLYISDNLIEPNELTGNDENWLVQEIENLVWLERSSRAGDEIVPKWDDHRRFGHHFDGIRALSYLLVSYIKSSKESRAHHPSQPIGWKRR